MITTILTTVIPPFLAASFGGVLFSIAGLVDFRGKLSRSDKWVFVGLPTMWLSALLAYILVLANF
jgi:type VI protein secretion system component VasK